MIIERWKADTPSRNSREGEWGRGNKRIPSQYLDLFACGRHSGDILAAMTAIQTIKSPPREGAGI